MMSAEEKIKSYAELESGWNFGAGAPFEDDTIRRALQVERNLRNRGFETDAFPGDDGEISVCYYWAECMDYGSVEYVIYPDGKCECDR